MATYSHSKVSCFENCPYQYKLKYVDKIEVDIPNTIEAFMGGIVHKVLEKIYVDKRVGVDVKKEDLLKFYKQEWDKEYSDKILIVKPEMKAMDYKRMGWSFILEYFNTYAPFEQMEILGLETEEKMKLPDGSEWHIRIDKLGKDKDGNYFVCDYKTSSRMKEQHYADTDRQLAMYSIWVRDKFKDAKSVKLVWHMLAFNQEVVSERNPEQERQLQEEVLIKIAQIEAAEKQGNFPTNITKLCDYCLYKSLCPEFECD
jgi:putative RecB family exonuclease